MRIGIPRILNMYENFPFWKMLFEGCGMEVALSPESTIQLYQSGISSVMSDNICFPAKLAHGHILALAAMKVDRIFYPIVPKENQENADTCNSYNCPVVSGYPEVIRSAVNPAENFNIPFDKPIMNFGNEKILKKQCWEYIVSLTTTDTQSAQKNLVSFVKKPRVLCGKKQFETAFNNALTARQEFLEKLIVPQREILQKALKTGELLFIVAGRPYHADPLIQQKVGQILSDLGGIALTDDVFRPIGTQMTQMEQMCTDKKLKISANWRFMRNPRSEKSGFNRLNIISQWTYPNRVVQAALEVAKLPQNVQLIQLNSFGCGPDSFFMEETGEILKAAGKNHIVLRIDEIASPGSIRLRLRSFIESITSIKN